MKQVRQKPSEVIENFLNYIDQCKTDYRIAYDIVGEEDSKDQDFKHELEFAPNKAERNKVATRYQQSRRLRRVNKDKVLELEAIVNFFDELNHKNTLNKMRQLLGKQRKTEEYLSGERVYKPRKKGDAVNE